ncbi:MULTISPECIES: ThuA domain-containing protein [Nocardioides]|uniref:ThuA domain-containing protein n=1 Tax=Nocardioides vastitatis TaxID=2568655 RepID=A0ABW0ZEJ6_9ACTN|nr:ThuA domain-containing protein [Nocardioides sp.]THJ04817.1 DUF1349 domain-containing protein [Nocardioides sp.]
MTVFSRTSFRFLSSTVAVALAATVGAAVPGPAQAHEDHGHILIFTEAPAGPWHDAAIAQGAPKLEAALEAAGMDATIVNDSTGVFTDEGLSSYDAMVAFQINGDPWTADEKAAMERWMAAGNGIAAVHNATDMRGNYAWWDEMVGSLMPGHAPTGTDPGQPGVVRIEDHDHPSTDHFAETRWQRSDEWYNFSNNVRGTAHILATMDETTYQGGTMGYDHPISWCKPYEGGRFWATALGHFPSHFDEPKFKEHLVGGVKYVAGLEPGDCGGTVWGNYEKVPLDQNTSAPFAMDVAPDGKVFLTELVRGQIRVYDPKSQTTSTAITIPVYSGGEDGLLGITLANDFATSGHLYIYYSPASPDDTDPANFVNRLSRLTYDHGTGTIDRATERVLLQVPARRLPDEPGHTGGGLDIDADGNLYLGVGDDVNPHSEPSGGYAPLSERNGTFHDARATSANTNDLRGKLLRITPKPDGSGYTIPEGNLFPESADAGDKTRPEIYAMGFRNPFRFSIDPETGWIGMADYSPDNSTDAPATRGPAGIAEWNLIKAPGNYGWPLCMGNNEPFRDVDYGSSTPNNPPIVGDFFDCQNPVNDSVHNTGLTNLPPARPADMFYGYKRSSVPAVINQGGGLAPMGGPFYQYDESLESDTKFPAAFDGKPFFYDWARNKMYNVQLKEDAGSTAPGGAVEKVNPFLPQEQFLAPIDSKFGPDGSLYVLDWGGGFGRDNPNSGLHRIDYIQGSRSPVASISAEPTSGHAPLTVAFDGSASSDPEGAELAYAWDFEDDGAVDATTATASHTYGTKGVHTARLTVTDPDGKDGTTTVAITVGNTQPTVEFNLPPSGSFFDFGDDISWEVQVTDPEDGVVSGDDVVIQPALGHDDHAHHTQPLSGLTGSTPTSLGGHAPDENIFFAIDARYQDKGGEGGANPLTGSATTVVFPKLRQAEFFDAKSENATLAPGRDPAGGGQVVVGGDGAWVRFDPVSFHRVDELALRVSAAAASSLELRQGAPDRELLATIDVPATGTAYRDVKVDVSELGADSRNIYVVFPGPAVRLNFLEALGQGSSPAARPQVAITAPQEGVQLEPDTDVQVTADASDADGTVATVEFFVGETKIGEDDTAPYEVTWRTPAEEDLYHLTAVATDNDGRTTTSRVSVAQVGELFGALQPFTNVNGAFEKLGPGQFRITGAGNDTWQAIDQYSTLFHPGAADEKWEAVVRVDAHTMTHGAAKAGIMVRNDITLPGVSPGYAMVALRPSGGIEFLTDTNGNGQLDSSVQSGTSGTPKWLKLRRDEGGYSAAWSNNGTTWTQVGTKLTLPGAAATQDIGIFEMSHEAAAKSADFSQFTVDTDPTDPAPEPISDPLSCPTGPLSDEFDGASMSPKWGLRYAAGSPITQSGGTLNLPVTTGDINEDETGPVSFAGQPVPAGDWTATTKVELAHTSHWQWAGIVVHQNDNNYNKLAFVRTQAGGRIIEFQTENNGSRTTPAAPAVPADFPTTVNLRLVNTGGTLTGAYSTDGAAWTSLNGSLALKPDARIGVMAAGDLGTTRAVAKADWFRFAPEPQATEVDPNDEFDGARLDGCRWAESVRYHSATEEVAGGHLRITTQPGDIDGNNPVSPRNFILQDAPEGDWVATTRFKAPLKHRYQLAGLLMYADDNNYVKTDVVAYNTPGAALDLRAEAGREVNGAISGGSNLNIADSTESGYWYLRVTKTGNQYVPEVSDGGTNWTPIGSGITFDRPLESLGLMAIGPSQEEPVVVEFDYFHLDAEEDDTTAPTTALTLDPSDADGENGWYVSAPSFTLAADDGDGSGVDSTEYRIGGGAWTPYEGTPVDLAGAADGEVVIGYRSTDQAGNVAEPATTRVRLDRDAPQTTPTVTDDGDTKVVTLTAEDRASGVAGTEVKVDDNAWHAYDAPVRIDAPGDHVVAYRSTDAAGLVEAAGSVTVTVTDTTGPVLRVTGLVAGRTYSHAAQPTLGWTATPTGSPVDRVVATIGHRTVGQGRLELWRFPVGGNVLTVTATDEAGNSTTVRVRFRVTTSIAAVRTLVQRFADQGSMNRRVERRILAHLATAARLDRRGRDRQAAAALVRARDVAGRIRVPVHRRVVRSDLAILIRRLR